MPKLRPGQTFPATIDGITYQIAVMSVGDRLDVDEALAAIKESTDTTEHVKTWLSLVSRFVKAWDQSESVDKLRYHVTMESLGQLFEAVMAGNEPSENDLKN